jgi:hypothetical protein
VGLAVLALVGASAVIIHAVGVTLLLGRIVHAVGLSRSTAASWPRAIGALATWIAYIALAAALIFYALP